MAQENYVMSIQRNMIMLEFIISQMVGYRMLEILEYKKVVEILLHF